LHITAIGEEEEEEFSSDSEHNQNIIESFVPSFLAGLSENFANIRLQLFEHFRLPTDRSADQPRRIGYVTYLGDDFA